MRILGLLVLLCGVCGASDSARQSSSQQTAVDSFHSDVGASGIVRPFDLALGDGSDSARDGNVTCYTIRNYMVKRESRHSDAVTPAGYSTCAASSKYGVKAVEESGKASPR
jgi:hypothetical protein